jgi:nucleoside-diphosphate-sugar epimerase
VKRVLVTGASGFIGRASLAPLEALGYQVHAVAAQPPLEALACARLHCADLLDRHAIDQLVDEVQATHLLHFAWIATPGVYWESADNARWLDASRHLLRRFQDAGGTRAVMAGSCAEYDWSRVTVCHELTSPLASDSGTKPSAYAESKLALYRALESCAGLKGFSAAWGRIFFQYGPHEHPRRLVASVIADLLQGREARCTHGTQVRSFLHVADVGSAFAALLDSVVQGAVNIGAAERITIRDLLLKIAAETGRAELLRLGAREVSPGEPATLVPDVQRLRDEVGFRPRLMLDEGLADAVRWWRAKLAMTGADDPP